MNMTSTPQRAASQRLERIGNYEIVRQIGRGGMSEVYLARHRSLENRLVAIKLLLSQDSEWIDRFAREATITSRLRHEHIIQIFDHGYQPPFFYTIMEYVEGGALRNILKPGQPLPADLALKIFRATGAALDYAHTHGVIHRDVSPGNILIEQDTGRVLLTDFGIARESGKTGYTTISKVMGTPGYLSPEHASSATSVTHLSDIYSLGVLLYEMLAGVSPWDHTPGMLDGSGGPFTAPPPLRSRGAQGLPPDVDRVLQTMLAIDPAKRYPSVHAAMEDLDEVMARHTGPTQVIGTNGASANAVPAPAQPNTIVPARQVEPHPVEKALGPDLLKAPMQKARERADTLSEQRELAGLLNQWSREGLAGGIFRRRLLGRQAAFHRVTSTNVYFYTLKVLYETRTPEQIEEEPDHKAQAPKLEREQDRWGLALPAPKGFQEEAGDKITLPGSAQVVECGVCDSKGRVVCPRCQGRARVIVNRDPAKPGLAAPSGPAPRHRGAATAVAAADAPPAPHAPALMPCPDCKGTGSLPCERCEGAGRLFLRKTTTWRRWPGTLRANDDLPRIDERWLFRTCQPTKVYQEQRLGDVRPEWKLVPDVAELVAQAQQSAGPDTRIALSELTVAFIPITELLFDLGDPKGRPDAGKGKGAGTPEAGLYSWHIYGFERRLPMDWRFVNWDRIWMLIFACALVLALGLSVLIPALRAG
jgi:eukaryotic-like serine/threonine-protein kinase